MNHDDTTFQIPLRPPTLLWLAILLGAMYTGYLYATDTTTPWPPSRILVPALMTAWALVATQILRARWHEYRQPAPQIIDPGPDIERIP